MDKCVILLGAGFPTIWGARVTSELTKRIRRSCYLGTYSQQFRILFERIWGNDLNESFYANSSPNFEHDIALFEYCSGFVKGEIPLKDSYQSKATSISDSLFELGILRRSNERYGNLQRQSYNSRLMNLGSSSLESVAMTELLPNYLLVLQKELSYCTDGYFLKEETINQILIRWLDSLATQFELNVYSLNYDLCIPQLDESYYLGFSDDGRPDDLGKILGYSGKSYLTLHGNFWMYNDFSTFEPRHHFKLSKKFQTAFFSEEFNPFISGINKEYKQVNPLDKFMERFKRDIEQSKIVYVIGYSGCDDHISEILKKAKTQLTAINPDSNGQLISTYKKKIGSTPKLIKEKTEDFLRKHFESRPL